MDSLLAYIDPGSGSLIIQAAIAAVIAIPIFLRSQIARAFQTLRRSGDETPGGDAPDDAPGGDDDAAPTV
jgi:hypothetical protein